MTLTEHPLLPVAWSVLERAIQQRHRVRLGYNGRDRLVCPHALGWKNGRVVALVYQCDGMTSEGPIATSPRQRWRSLFLDDIEHAGMASGVWQSADNYSLDTILMDTVVVAVKPK